MLRECPAQKWLTIDELFRLLKVLTQDYYVSRDPWKLYIGEQQYGSLGYEGDYAWETLQGRFVLAFLFEYAATLGLIDVAYISPDGARNDFRDRWGTDDLSCLSRYDGLMFFRINSLGGWCLGLTDKYEAEVVPVERVAEGAAQPRRGGQRQALESGRRPLPGAVRRAAVRGGLAPVRPTRSWRRSNRDCRSKELTEFLAAKSQVPLPQTVEVFLDDLAKQDRPACR